MADYREHDEKILAAGATFVAVSVDPPDKTEPLRRELHLPFTILCDTDRHVVKEWDIYNPREREGIAKPAVFVIAPDRTVRYASVDGIATRVPASEIVRVLESATGAKSTRRKIYIPTPGDFVRAVRNNLSYKASRKRT